MRSISRYHISVREDGLWNVIDSSTGGPAEIMFKGHPLLLFKLDRADAEALSKFLNERARGIFQQKSEPPIE